MIRVHFTRDSRRLVKVSRADGVRYKKGMCRLLMFVYSSVLFIVRGDSRCGKFGVRNSCIERSKGFSV